MRNNTILIFKTILVCLLLLIVGVAYSGPGKKTNTYAGNSSFCLEISGQVTIKSKHHFHAPKTNDSYAVELLYYNTVVDSINVKDISTFKFHLKKNAYYGIRITKKGCLPRLISVCTDMPKSRRDVMFKFHFDTDLIDDSEKGHLNKSALDFPIAVVSFDKEAGWFYFNEEYTAHIKQKIYAKNITDK